MHEGLISFVAADAPPGKARPPILGPATLVHIPPELVRISCGHDGGPWRTAQGERWPRLANVVAWLDRLHGADPAGPDPLVQQLVTRLATSAFGELSLRADDAWLPPSALARVWTVATAAGANRTTVPALARETGLSVSAFSRGFRGSTGMTPGEFLIGLRMDRAATLLATTELPVAAIAKSTGLSGAAHLGTLFRAHFGTSPSGFRLASRS